IENISIRLKRIAQTEELVVLRADFLKERSVEDEDDLTPQQLADYNNLDTKMRVVTLTDNDNLEKIIDYRIYSDFLGLINETSNGIINFEAKVKIPLMHSNIRNTNFYVFKNISPEVR